MPQHARTAAKAEVFEDVLARVSRQLAKAARASAQELREERLAAARGNPSASTEGEGETASAATRVKSSQDQAEDAGDQTSACIDSCDHGAEAGQARLPVTSVSAASGA